MKTRGRFVAAILTGVLGLAGCTSASNATSGKSSEQGGVVKGAEARQLVAQGATLLDVRTPGEFRAGHIEGAKLIPVQELGSRIAEVGSRDVPVVVYCRSGNRSATAARMLRDAGYKVYDLGPMSAW